MIERTVGDVDDGLCALMKPANAGEDMTMLRKTGLFSARIAGAALAVALLLGAPLATAKPDPDREVHWSNWRALGSGYVGRQRVPPKAEQPAERRRLATTQERRRGKRARRAARRAAHRTASLTSLDVTATATAATSDAVVSALWLRTNAAGLYGVAVADLAAELGRAAGGVRRNAARGRLSLTSENQPVSWYFDAAADKILFAGEAYDSFHTDENAYRFWIAGRKARPMGVVASAPTDAYGMESPFRDTLTFEEEPDLMYSTWAVAAEPDADYWFWDYLYGGYRDEIRLALQIPHPAPDGKAQIRVRLRGWTDLQAGDDHQVSGELNGEPLRDEFGNEVIAIWDGFDEALLVGYVDQSLLDPSGDNTLVLFSHFTLGTHPGQFLDDIEIDYARRPVAVDGTLWLHALAAGVQTVSGFASDDVLVIEAPTGAAVMREDVRADPDGNGGWSVTFEAVGGTDYLVAERGAAATAVLAPDYRSTLRRRANRAEYLIVAPREFSGTAEALAAHRSAQFSDVEIAWLDDIYDEFSAGREDPSAIGRFMRRVARWEVTPSNVVLIGKGSLDHKDRMGYGDSFLPVLMTATPWALAASDDRLLGVDGGAPFAIGRLPITNDAEGVAYVEKLVTYEATPPGDERYRAVVAADNPDNAGDFHANSDELTDRLLGELGFDQVRQLYHPDDAVRADLIESATWEAGYVSYDGHGSAAQVGDGRESFITATDAAALHNPSYPLFTALTCASGDDTNPGARSLAGALVLNPAGGAIASLAPTGLSLDGDAQLLGMAFVDNLFLGDSSIGEAVRQAKAQTDGAISAFMPRMYSVIGEPLVQARQDGI